MKVYIGPYQQEVGEQEVIVRIDDYDLWSMDHTLAKIIEPMLVKLAVTKQGSPYVSINDCPEQIKPSPEVVIDGVDDTHHKRWDWVIGEMIWAFSQKNYDWEAQYYNPDAEPYSESSDHVAMKAHQQRMSNGFRLFGKYYENLWD